MKTCTKCGLQKGLDQFYRHKECKDGVRPSCISCVAEYSKINRERVNSNNRASRARNKEKIKKWHAENYKKNKEKINARIKEWQADNKDRRYARNSEWKKENPNKVRSYFHTRRARMSGGPGKLSPDIADRLMVLQKGKCASCAVPLKKSGFHMDHITPLVMGGPNEDSNIQLLCPTCNLKKGSKHPADFMQSRGLLL